MTIAAGTSRGVTTDLPDAAKPDHLTEALRRHGVLLAGRVRDVTTEGPRDTLVSRIARLKLTFEVASLVVLRPTLSSLFRLTGWHGLILKADARPMLWRCC